MQAAFVIYNKNMFVTLCNSLYFRKNIFLYRQNIKKRCIIIEKENFTYIKATYYKFSCNVEKTEVNMKIKKILLGAVAFAVTAIVCALTAGAEKAGDYQISATGVDTATITSYSGSATNLTIPSKLNGMKITQIDFNAFSGNKKLTKVTIPDTVTTIGNSAFEDCTSLASVDIPSSVTGIGVAAFDNTKILNNQSKASAQYIGKWLISADTENLSVKVGTVGIADYACFFNENLTTLKLPSGLKYIGICSFGLCTNLFSANIPATVEKIGVVAFDGSGIAQYQLDNSDIAYIDKWVVAANDEVRSADIAAGTVGIADYVFSETSLDKVTLPSSLKYIGECAFMRCGLWTVTVPAGVIDIGMGAFAQCNNLSTVKVSASNKNYSSKDGVLYNKNKSVIICYPKSKNDTTFTIPSTVTAIYDTAFAGNKYLKSVTMPSSVKSVGDGAFGQIYTLSSIKMSSGMKYIGAFAFLDCKSLSSVTLSSNLRDIGEYAFLGCAKLSKIVIPRSVKNIMPYAVGYCYKNDNFDRTYVRFGFTIYGYGGEAKRYANENNINYELLTDVPAVTGAKLGGRAADALRINWSKNASADGYIVEMYQGNKWVRVGKITNNSTTTFRKAGLKASTVYKFRVRAYKMSGNTALYGNYSATVTARTKPSVMTGVKIGGKAKDALRVNWTKNTSAQGYIVEIYKGGKWVRVAKITNNSTTTFRKAGLAKNTAYKFRVRAYHMSGKTALYGNYGSVSGRTLAK